ncbi:hypothetical protein AB0K16_40320 [Nonomuraea jabiensis]|uniref:sodium:solute symporter family transporter n=1 Tax=Nonomuraea jabiensis TaxID=882448 RepID=UPI0034455155
MMPFYYGSKVRSVPEFMRRRFGPGARLVNAISFALAQVLIAGINLFLLATVVSGLLGWPLWVALLLAAVIVLSYITLGGLSAAIYNEVLQFSSSSPRCCRSPSSGCTASAVSTG